MSDQQYSPLDIETVAIRIQTVIATIQLAIDDLPNDGRVGDIPDVLALCVNCLSDQHRELYEIMEGLKPPLEAMDFIAETRAAALRKGLGARS